MLREARLLARVRHPNVATVYDADEIDGRVGLWMEFIHGRDLEQIVREQKRFNDGEVTRIGIEVCRALAAVHDAGLLHRDIKAQNVMQTVDGRLVLMDFGTGQELEQTPSADVDTAGTPLYLAPELFDGGAATVRSDVYSAGVLLFHLLTGGYPVRGETVKEVHDAHGRGERVDLAAKAPRAKKTLAAGISRAIDPDPSRRFTTSREMLVALERVRGKAEERKKRRTVLVFAAAGAVAVGLAVIPGLRRGKDSNRPAPAAGTYFGVTPEKRVIKTPPVFFTGTPSPDGRYLPFSEFATGNPALYEFATGDIRVLRKGGDGGDIFATQSIVSPDSSQVAYDWTIPSCDCTQLRVIDATGATTACSRRARGRRKSTRSSGLVTAKFSAREKARTAKPKSSSYRARMAPSANRHDSTGRKCDSVAGHALPGLRTGRRRQRRERYLRLQDRHGRGDPDSHRIVIRFQSAVDTGRVRSRLHEHANRRSRARGFSASKRDGWTGGPSFSKRTWAPSIRSH